MGTRNLICVMQNEEYKVAQYASTNGYPSRQGVRILHILRNEETVKKLKENLKKCRWISPAELKICRKNVGYKPNEPIVPCIPCDTDKFSETYPHLTGDTGASVLELIAESTNGLNLIDSLEFGKNSLFCEWAYVVDFDKNTFEVYKGLNQAPVDSSERFYFDGACDKYGYYSVRFLKSFDLSNLPTDEEFISSCKVADATE